MLEMAHEEEMSVLRSPINSMQEAPGWCCIWVSVPTTELTKTSMADSLLPVSCQYAHTQKITESLNCLDCKRP